jgi:NAD/NADP transhydrogenase alpha subunit
MPKIGAMAVHGLAAFVLEDVPRITLAQSIDVQSL